MENQNQNQLSIKEKINQAVSKIREFTQKKPEIGIILGTGLGGVIKDVNQEVTIKYSDLPHFPVSTVESHQGNLIFGKIKNQDVVIMQGRMHYYEGYSMKEITFPIYVMKALGIKTLLISNACGSVNPRLPKASIMIIDDHINLLGDNPLIGPNDASLGVRFPDMSEPYSQELIKLAEDIALEEKIKIYKGVYAAMTGPNLETKAEYRMLQYIGADVVGMSTVPECIVANYLGLKVFGVSIVTDECYPDALKPAKLEEILEIASNTEPKLTKLIEKMLEKL
jgi:purine-nucleoside phosphorylase